MPLLADVAVPVPLAHAFTYAVPDALAERVTAGTRVLCNFGRRQAIGVVLSAVEREVPAHITNLRPIAGVLDDEPVLPGELVRFLSELSSGVTGEVHHVDAGYHVVGMKQEDAPDISLV